MTDKPLTDQELDRLWEKSEPSEFDTPDEAAIAATQRRLVAEVRRLRFIEHETRLVLVGELGPEVIEDEGLEDLHIADLARRLFKERP